MSLRNTISTGDVTSAALKKSWLTEDYPAGLTALTRKWHVNKTPRRVLLTTQGQTGDEDGFTRIMNRFPALTKENIFGFILFPRQET